MHTHTHAHTDMSVLALQYREYLIPWYCAISQHFDNVDLQFELFFSVTEF